MFKNFLDCFHFDFWTLGFLFNSSFENFIQCKSNQKIISEYIDCIREFAIWWIFFADICWDVKLEEHEHDFFLKNFKTFIYYKTNYHTNYRPYIEFRNIQFIYRFVFYRILRTGGLSRIKFFFKKLNNAFFVIEKNHKTKTRSLSFFYYKIFRKNKIKVGYAQWKVEWYS